MDRKCVCVCVRLHKGVCVCGFMRVCLNGCVYF